MTNSKHTPTPWLAWNNFASTDDDEAPTVEVRYGSNFIASVNDIPDAKHIVRCVNAHDELVAALREIVAMTDEDAGTFRKRGGTYRGLVGIVASAALAKVEN